MLNNPNPRLAKAYDAFMRMMTPPPDDLEAQCEALKEQCTSKLVFAEQMLALIGETQDIELIGLACEACAVAGEPKAAETINWTLRILGMAGDFGHVREEMRSSAQSRAYRLLGESYTSLGRLEDALPAYESACACCPAVGNYLAVAKTQIAMGRLDDAQATILAFRARMHRGDFFISHDVDVMHPASAREAHGIEVWMRASERMINDVLMEIEDKRGAAQPKE